MVYVYRNLRQVCWSIMQNNRVSERKKEVFLSNCSFVVRPAGRARVLRERRKHVHAFVKGEVTTPPGDITGMTQVTYNPYLAGYFYRKDTGQAVGGAGLVCLRKDGTCWACL